MNTNRQQEELAYINQQHTDEKAHPDENICDTSTTRASVESYHDDEFYLPTIETRFEKLNSYADDTVRAITFESLTSGVTRCVATLIPSFFHLKKRNHAPKVLKSTSWLDGLRGVAALLVVIHHYSGLWYLPLWSKSLAAATGPWETFFQIPYVKLFYFAGYLYVAMFFVISGYSLSYKPLSLIRANQATKFLDALSSSAFRRAFRLFLPPIAVTFGVMITVQFGWRAPEDPAYIADSFVGNLGMWLYDAAALFDPLRPMPKSMDDSARHYSAYDIHLWTIPVEFQGSMAVFIILLASSKLTSMIRMVLVSILLGYCFYFNYLYHATFIAGILLAEANFVYAEALAIQSILSSTTATVFRECLCFLLLFFALHLAISTPRLEYFSAIIHVLSINYSNLLQLLFTTHFAQYLGRISFSLYMVHGTIMITLCSWLMPWIGTFIRDTEDMDWSFVWTTVLTSCIAFPATICLADWVTRYIDDTAVNLAAKLWRKIASVDER